MYTSMLDIEVNADYQRSEVRRVRQQPSLPPTPPRVRIALAHLLIALANRLWQPAPVVLPQGS